MSLWPLIARNAWRNRLRTSLTVLGLAVAIMAYGLLNTVVEAWYASADASASTRLVTRSAIAITYPLPLTHAPRIRDVPGVATLTWLTWFGGSYGDNRQPFAKIAVDAASYFRVYPEYRLKAEEQRAFEQDRQGAVIGPKLAATFGLQLGDVMPIRGDRFVGNWRFTVRGIYQPRDDKADDALMFVHWGLLSDTLRARTGNGLPDQVGVYVVGIDDAAQAVPVSARIDALFRDSPAVTRTETERAYQLSIVAMSRNIILSLQLVSVGLIVIIMAVMTNTMTMSANERLVEYATLKALGFTPAHVAGLLLGESLLIVLLGAALGVACTYPASAWLVSAVGSLVRGFYVAPATLAAQLGAALLVGLVAAAWPAWVMSRLNVARALRAAA
jgi:putative ABC transport system permease protein